MKKKARFPQPLDRYFHDLDANFKHRGFYALFIALLFFGVLGLVWTIPFPQLRFLERMNAQTFLNWGSFYIAVVVYLYLRLAPRLSYAVLFAIGVMSFFIVRLEYAERDGGLAVWMVCLASALAGCIGIWLTSRQEARKPGARELCKLAAIGPIWLFSKILSR